MVIFLNFYTIQLASHQSFQNPVTGIYMRIPGEGPSSETINCSCSVAFIPNPEVFNDGTLSDDTFVSLG